MATVKWERVEDGIYRRLGKDGKPIYTAVRQAGARRPDGTYPQQRRTFNGGRIENALREARLWRAAESIALDRGQELAPAAGKLTLKEAFDRLNNDSSVQYAEATRRLRADLFRALEKASPGIESRKLNSITTANLRGALAKINGDVYRDKARQLVHGLYEYLEVTPNPAVKVKDRRTRAKRMSENGNGKAERYLDAGSVEAIIAAMPERYRMLVRLLWRMGLRPGEALALTVGQVDPETNTLTIDRAVNNGVVGPTKTGVVRHPIMPTSVSDALYDHIRRFSDFTQADALVFTTETGGMIDLHNFRQRVWATACKAAGIKADIYSLRHTACSDAIAAGADLASVSEMVGNSVAVLAATYVHASRSAQVRTAGLLDAAIRGEKVSA